MKRKLLVPAAFSLLTAVCFAPLPAMAVPVVDSLGAPLTLNSSNLTTAGTAGDHWLLNETFTGTTGGTLRFTDTDGTPLANGVPPYTSGSWFTKTVLNSSGTPWTSFEMELQQILGVPSPDGDGLSFAQGGGLVFSSSVFSTITRIDITRDYLNFSNGTVPAGGSVTFSFAVTDNSPQSPFYILETPNRVDRVPEPPSILLVGLALAAFAFARRKKA